jgi:GntR family transcriptional regulator / MocR family aminotransferase
VETQTNLAWDTLLELDAGSSSGPLHVRLTSAIRDAIRTGRIPVGSALPPTRQLAADLGCSRWVATEAYEQLVSEGYLEARIGSGTRVRLRDVARSSPSRPAGEASASWRFDLTPGLPDFHAFPRAPWSRALRDALASMPDRDFDYQAPGGHPRVRRVIADYLRRVRGASIEPGDVTITAGILDGVTLVSRALLAGGLRRIAVEDPTWPRVIETARQVGLEVVPVEVDADGMRTESLRSLDVGAVIVAPSHQFPTGAVLSPSRRLVLLEWARATGGMVLEDDYDAEFRYDRRPVGTLQGIDPAHTILFGSLSKTLAPAIGLGWAVTPPPWTERIRSAETRLTGPSVVQQLAFAGFIENGDYDRHLRRLRRRYRQLRDRFVTAVSRQLPGCSVSGAAAGLHVLVSLPRGVSGEGVVKAAAAAGILLKDLREFRLQSGIPDEGIVLGYGNLREDTIEPLVSELAQMIRELIATRTVLVSTSARSGPSAHAHRRVGSSVRTDASRRP